MRLKLLSIARLDIKHTFEYYEGEQAGLGESFWLELKNHLIWIQKNPEIPSLRNDAYRRVNLKRFPYHVIYILRDNRILVIAVPHSHSEPEYWIDRI